MPNIDECALLNSEELLDRINKMNSFGVRYTGSTAHKKFIDYLKSQVAELGFETFSDERNFKRWEAKKASVTIHSKDGDIDIPVSSPYPYSGETPPEGVRGKLISVHEKHVGFITKAKDNVCIVKVSTLSVPTILVEDKRNSKPEGIDLPRRYGGPVLTTFANFPLLKVAKMSGAKAVICVWNGISDECTKGQYLPFILDYQGMPAVWVSPSEGKRLMKAVRDEDEATVVLDADIEEDCTSETFYSIIEGKNTKEAILINTHTDGVNCVEENGPFALLSMMRYFKAHKPERTMIFIFMTGHFRLPSFKEMGSMQCTSVWLYNHPELWDGKEDHINAVAGLTIEHLGCKEFTDNESHSVYMNTDPIDIEMCYTSNDKVDEIYYKALEGRENVRTITYRGCNALHFGEGQPLFDVGIPTIALVPGPSYLCVVDEENHCMDKFDVKLMESQIETYTKAALLLNEMPAEEIGRADGYSFGVIKKYQPKPFIDAVVSKVTSIFSTDKKENNE